MKILQKIVVWLKELFYKKERTKLLEESKQILNQEEKVNFIENLKVNIIEKRKKKKIETLVCEGDGLGIQKKVDYQKFFPIVSVIFQKSILIFGAQFMIYLIIKK